MKHKGNGRRAWLGRGEEIEEEKNEGGGGDWYVEVKYWRLPEFSLFF